MPNDVVPPEDGAAGSFGQVLDRMTGHHMWVTSRYDAKRRSGSDPHVGVDSQVKGPPGNQPGVNPVTAPINGTVVENDVPGGTSIVGIQDDKGYIVRVLHMSDRDVKVGQRVFAYKTVIGKESNIGVHVPTHMHVDVLDPNGDHLDPNTFFGGPAPEEAPMANKPYWDPYYPGVHMHKEGKKYVPYTNDPPKYSPNQNNSSPEDNSGPALDGTDNEKQPQEKQPQYDSPPWPGQKPGEPLQLHPPFPRKKTAARRDGSNIMVTKHPDVCLTPKGGCSVPVAYNSVAHLDPSERVSPDVHINKQPDFNLNSRSRKITGHHPGSDKGKVVKGYELYSHAMAASASVYSNGWAEVRDQDPAWINHPNVGPIEPMRPMKNVDIATLWPVSNTGAKS